MKLYIFTLNHLSTVQKGIQAAHAAVELFAHGSKVLADWAEHHKTIVMLEGGDYASMRQLAEWALHDDQEFHTSVFVEDDETLGGLLTAVAVIIPFDIPIEITKYAKMTEPTQELFRATNSRRKVIV